MCYDAYALVRVLHVVMGIGKKNVGGFAYKTALSSLCTHGPQNPTLSLVFVCVTHTGMRYSADSVLWAVVGRSGMGSWIPVARDVDYPPFFCYAKKGRYAQRKGIHAMGKIPNELRKIIARNIKECRLKKFPGYGGGARCAEAFGVSPQQWSPWERGMRTPDEVRLSQLADFFGVTVEWMCRDNRPPPARKPQESPPPGIGQGCPHMLSPEGIAGVDFPPPPSWNPVQPGSAASFYWLAQHFFKSIETHGLHLDKQSLEYLAECIKKS